MNTKQLFFKFNQGINWNAIIAVSHRILAGVLSYSLYRVCTTADYNLWANTHSIIFIILLWIDGGLRKSTPRFAPLFAAHGTTRSFLKYLIFFQAITLALAIPIVIAASAKLHAKLLIGYSIIPQIIILFVLEGIISCVRLIYYSYFWHKSFNQIYLFMMTLETIAGCMLILYGIMPLIPAIILLKIISCIILIMATTIKIPTIINDPLYQDIKVSKADESADTASKFTIHTIAMWGSNAIKSLSERNVMLLAFTYIFGPAQANIFKLANDGAVIVYRTLIKTIGTTDTSLLAHSQIIGEGQVGLEKAFKKLSTKIVGLCLPLLGLMGGVYSLIFWYGYDHIVFHIIFILIMGYVLEVAFSAYERVLEVNFRYRYLIYAYIPYLILISFPLFIPLLLSIPLTSDLVSRITCIGLIGCLISIRSVRLVSTLLTVRFAHRLYSLSFPVSLRTCITRLGVSYALGLLLGAVLIPVGVMFISYFPAYAGRVPLQ